MKYVSSLLNGFVILEMLALSGPIKAQEQSINLNVSNADIQLIGKGLGALPYGEVASLMIKLQTQINNQVKPVAGSQPAEVKATDKPELKPSIDPK